MKERIIFIDIAKAISIILVATAHSQLFDYFPETVAAMSLIRLPFFFFIAGVLFSEPASFYRLALKKTDSLLKPYFVTAFFFLIIVFFVKDIDIGKAFVGIFYGYISVLMLEPLWFLPHLWLVLMVAYLFLKLTNMSSRTNVVKVLMLIFIAIMGYLSFEYIQYKEIFFVGTEYSLVGLPFTLDIVLVTLLFFLSGYSLKSYAVNFCLSPKILCISLITFFAVIFFTDAYINLSRKVFVSPIFVFLGSCSGIYILFSLSVYMSKHRFLASLLSAIGSSSLFVLIFHGIFSMIIYKLYKLLFSVDSSPVMAICMFLASIILPVFLKKLFEQNPLLRVLYFPLPLVNKNR